MYTFDQLNEDAKRNVIESIKLIVTTDIMKECAQAFLEDKGLVGKDGRPLEISYDKQGDAMFLASDQIDQIDLERLRRYLADTDPVKGKGLISQNMRKTLECRERLNYNLSADLIKNHISAAIEQLNEIFNLSYTQLICQTNLLEYLGDLRFTKEGKPLSTKELRLALSEDLSEDSHNIRLSTLRAFDRFTEDAKRIVLENIKLIVTIEFHKNIEKKAVRFLSENGLAGKGDHLMVEYGDVVDVSGEIDTEFLGKYLDISLESIEILSIEGTEIRLEFKQRAHRDSLANLIIDHLSRILNQLNDMLAESYARLTSPSNILKYAGNLRLSDSGNIPQELQQKLQRKLQQAIADDFQLIFGEMALLIEVTKELPEHEGFDGSL